MITSNKKELHPDFPEEYITGSVVFFGRTFRVTPDVLIPRLETEVLVKRTRKILTSKEKSILIDIGTGSGIIATSCVDLASEVIAIDISQEALSVAKRNFETYFPEKSSHFLISDLLSIFLKKKEDFLWKDQNIVITANLPYIKQDDWENMSSDTHFEPKLALFGGEKTGFEMYERLFFQIGNILMDQKPKTLTLIIEFGFDQREMAEEIIKNYGWKYNFFGDYRGIERFCEINMI